MIRLQTQNMDMDFDKHFFNEQLSLVGVASPDEDLRTYTEVDIPANRITSITAARVQMTNCDDDETVYLYRDRGVDHYSGDYEHLLTIYLDTITNTGHAVFWAITNGIDDCYSLHNGGGDLHWIECYGDTGPPSELFLLETVAGAWLADVYSMLWDTPYYLRVKRDESVGANGTLYLYIYSDALRTILLDTLSVALREKEDFRYQFAISSYNEGDAGEAATYYTQHLNLQEAGAGAGISSMRL
ncbi:hypothetical protein ES702_04958 [subsurface metagenome]